MRAFHLAVRLTILGSIALPVSAAAATDPLIKCQSKKLSAAAKASDAAVKCHAKALLKGVPVDASCLTKASDKLAAAFTKAEKEIACPAPADAATTQGFIDAYVADLVTALPPGASGAKCASKKMKGAGKHGASFLKAFSKDAKKPDPLKLSEEGVKTTAKVTKTFDSSEAKLDCETAGDVDSVTRRVDELVNEVRGVVPSCPPQLIYSNEGNRMRRYDVDTVGSGALVEDVLIPSASDDPIDGRDVNGAICRVPGGAGEFVCGEDTGQPSPPPGWGLFDSAGVHIGKNTPTFFTSSAEPFGCAFEASGNLFTTSVGDQPVGTNGQLIMWFPPYDEFPGLPGEYPATNDVSTNFCKIATDLSVTGNVAIGADGSVYVASAVALGVRRYNPPFPTAPNPGGGCGLLDGQGSPMADTVDFETFVSDPANVATPTGLAIAPNGNWYISSVFTGVIAEYDTDGAFVRRLLSPPEGEGLPYSTGHPQSVVVDCRGDIYYTDLNLTISGGIGPGPNGGVFRLQLDAVGNPRTPELVRDGLAFPDGLGVFDGDLEGP